MKPYTVLVCMVAAERLVELVISSRHARRSFARGGVEAGARHYPAMVAVHTGFIFACPLEVWAFGRPWLPFLGIPMIGLLAAAAAMRVWAMATLGDRWSTRVIYVPGEAMVARGPYRWLRHPNYLAVAIEFLALPLVHSAWLTAIVFGAANGLVLRQRIAVENATLEKYARRQP